jgi:FkbM family methyltransferase
MNLCFGKALYKINDISLFLSPLSLVDQKLITSQEHDLYVVNSMLMALQEGGNFIDVGAHIGYMSIQAATLLGDKGIVFSFEPSVREFQQLRRNIDINKLTNVKVFNKGIGSNEETNYLYLSYLGNTGMNSRQNITKSSVYTIAKFSPVHRVISTSDLLSVKCVKIDVEGDEMSVLQGFEKSMNLLRQSTFIIEITKDYLEVAGYKPQDIYDFFYRHSFKPLNNKSVCNQSQYDEIFVYSQ